MKNKFIYYLVKLFAWVINADAIIFNVKFSGKDIHVTTRNGEGFKTAVIMDNHFENLDGNNN